MIKIVDFQNGLLFCDMQRRTYQNFIMNLNFNMSQQIKPHQVASPQAFRPIIPKPQSQAKQRPLAQVPQPSPLSMKENGAISQFSVHYYHEYQRLLRQNTILNNQIALISREKDDLQIKYRQLKREHSEEEERKRRHRRPANEISRNFNCPVKDCAKSYGSEGSLIQHLKLKHAQFYSQGKYEELMMAKPRKNSKQLHSQPQIKTTSLKIEQKEH